MLCICFLCVDFDDNLSVENSVSLITQDALVKFMTLTVWFSVMNCGVVVYQPLPICNVESIQGATDSFTIKNRQDVIPHNIPAKRNRMR